MGVLVKLTFIGTVPSVGLAEAAAVSDGLTAIESVFAEAVRPVLSVTIRLTPNVPGAPNAWLGFWLPELVPSPKVHAYVYGAAPPDAAPVNPIATEASPEVVLAEALATSAGLTLTVKVTAALCPAESVILRPAA